MNNVLPTLNSSVNSQKSLAQNEEKWYTIQNLADWCGLSVDRVKHLIGNELRYAIDSTSQKKGGYHNSQVFYSENVLKALKEYQIKTSGSNATKNKDVVTSGNISFIQNQTIQAILDDPKALMQLVAMSSQKAIEMQQRAEIAEAKNELLASETLTWADRKVLDALVKKYANKYGDSQYKFQNAWNDFKKELYYKHGINLESRKTNYLNNGGKPSKLKILKLLSDEELPKSLRTALSMCEAEKISTDEIISKSKTLQITE